MNLQELERIAREAIRREIDARSFQEWCNAQYDFDRTFQPDLVANLIAVAKAAKPIAEGTDTAADHTALIAAFATLAAAIGET